MNQNLVEEIEDMIDLLTKSGFFSTDEIMEILEDQFIDEEIDFTKFNISQNDFSNENFSKLEKAFTDLSKEDILTIHNCGYDIKEGLEDVFELYIHLYNNNFKPIGFCFYTLEDVEQSIFDSELKITFGDFEKNEKKAFDIGMKIYNHLKDQFNITWDENVNSQIIINNFKWDKKYDEDTEYEMEGAYNIFTTNQVLE